jgi:hypothetical protein
VQYDPDQSKQVQEAASSMSVAVFCECQVYAPKSRSLCSIRVKAPVHCIYMYEGVDAWIWMLFGVCACVCACSCLHSLNPVHVSGSRVTCDCNSVKKGQGATQACSQCRANNFGASMPNQIIFILLTFCVHLCGYVHLHLASKCKGVCLSHRTTCLPCNVYEVTS